MQHISNPILNRLKTNGHRLTQARIVLIDIILKSKKPLAADDILKLLEERRLSVNKTTVYREIEFLRVQGILSELHFDDRKKRYELTSRDHHHHLICFMCKGVDDIVLMPEILKAERAQEAKISQERGFKVMNHCMEFFGLCKKCQ